MLGKCLGLTNNRMDMVEWDCPANAKQDAVCLAMLKAWRDEERGKVRDMQYLKTLKYVRYVIFTCKVHDCKCTLATRYSKNTHTCICICILTYM